MLNRLSSSLAPSFIAAACYMVFGRLIWLVTPATWRGFRSLWVPARWITPIFVTLDLLSFFIQLAGLGSVASAHSPNISAEESQKRLENGTSTLKTGLIVQLFGFGIFTVIGLRFVVVSRKWKNDWPDDGGRWRRCVWVINICCALIMVSLNDGITSGLLVDLRPTDASRVQSGGVHGHTRARKLFRQVRVAILGL